VLLIIARLRIRIFNRMKKLDPDPHLGENLETDLHKSQNSGALKGQNKAMEAHNEGVEAQKRSPGGGSEDRSSQIRITQFISGSASKRKYGSGSALK
jgi:hypothetical protein